jgi:hypothetical protein
MKPSPLFSSCISIRLAASPPSFHIIAHTMLTDEECAALDQEWTKAYVRNCFNRDANDPFDGEDWLNENVKLADRERYMDWRRHDIMRRHQAATPPSAATYFKQVNNTQFTENVSLSGLAHLLNEGGHLYILIGTHKEYIYWLSPITWALQPFEEDINRNDTRDRCCDSILGLIKGTGPPKVPSCWDSPPALPRKARLDKTSSSNDSSIGNDSTGFTFMQLGIVKYVHESTGAENVAAHKDPTDMMWDNTEYVLVVEINDNGRAGAVWMLYNFNAIDFIECERLQPAETETNWGYLPDCDEKRAGFKIANNVEELGEGEGRWSFSEVLEAEYVLVAAVYVERDGEERRIVRQKVLRAHAT